MKVSLIDDDVSTSSGQSRTRPQWILGESGAQKVALLAKAYFGACAKRVEKRVGNKPYQSWMSSQDYCKALLNDKSAAIPIQPLSSFDTRREFLAQIDFLWPHEEDEFKVFVDFDDIAENSRRVFTRAIDLVDNWSSWQRLIYRTTILQIVPICGVRSGKVRERGSSYSTKELLGTVFTSVARTSSFPDLRLTIDIAHELGHQVLMLYQYSGDLIEDPEVWVYSGFRKTLRPAVYSLHAAVALAYMLECIRSLQKCETQIDRVAYLQSLSAEYTECLGLGIDALKCVDKTRIGQLIMADLEVCYNMSSR